MRRAHFVRIVAAAMVVAAITVPVNRAAAADCDGMEAKIAAAKTAAEHEAVATCYDAMAKEASERSALHKKMGESYKTLGGFAVRHSLPQHCTYFAKSFGAEAKTYAEMAATHREMAKRAH